MLQRKPWQTPYVSFYLSLLKYSSTTLGNLSHILRYDDDWDIYPEILETLICRQLISVFGLLYLLKQLVICCDQLNILTMQTCVGKTGMFRSSSQRVLSLVHIIIMIHIFSRFPSFVLSGISKPQAKQWMDLPLMILRSNHSIHH